MVLIIARAWSNKLYWFNECTYHCLIDCELWLQVLGQSNECSLVTHLVTIEMEGGSEQHSTTVYMYTDSTYQ